MSEGRKESRREGRKAGRKERGEAGGDSTQSTLSVERAPPLEPGLFAVLCASGHFYTPDTNLFAVRPNFHYVLSFLLAFFQSRLSFPPHPARSRVESRNAIISGSLDVNHSLLKVLIAYLSLGGELLGGPASEPVASFSFSPVAEIN